MDLILGSGGTIGSAFIRSLDTKLDNVLQVDHRTDFPIRGKFVEADLNDPMSLDYIFSLHGYDKLFQFAADSGSIDYLTSPEYFYGASTMINLNIIKAIKKYNNVRKVIFPSSFYRYIYRHQYGEEKKYNENLFFYNFRKPKEPKVHIPILWPTYGPYCELRNKNEKIIPMLCRRFINAKDGDNIYLELNPDDGRYFVYIDDAIAGIKKLSSTTDVSIIDIGGVEFITFREITRELKFISNKDIRLSFSKFHTIMDLEPNLKLTFSEIDWNPTVEFKKGLLKTYKWIEGEIKYGN
jgi:nucleoside-diphosphate-sugar epimerase